MRRSSTWNATKSSPSAPSVTDLIESNPTADVMLRWAKDRGLRRLRSDHVAGLPEEPLLTDWAGVLYRFGVTDAERITVLLDRAHAAANRSGEWRTWSFLTLQIQLAAGGMQVYQPSGSMSCTDAWVEVPEDPV
jgi:hypothetical protein